MEQEGVPDEGGGVEDVDVQLFVLKVQLAVQESVPPLNPREIHV